MHWFLFIPAGSLNATGTISTVLDTLHENNETIVIDIAAVTNATESGDQQATITILDDDDAPPLPPGPFPVSNATDASRNTVVAFNFERDVLAATDQSFTVSGSSSVGRLAGGR